MKLIFGVVVTLLSAVAAASDETVVNARVCSTGETSAFDKTDEVKIGMTEVRGVADSIPLGGS